MISISSWHALEGVLLTPIDAELGSLLLFRRDQLAEWGDEYASFTIVEAGDDPGCLEPPPLINLVDGSRYGEPGFEPSWEAIQKHSGWFELTYVLCDAGTGHIIFVPDAEGVDADLLNVCRDHSSPHSTRGATEEAGE